MGIMETLQGMKEYEAQHPITPMEKKKRGLKDTKKGVSIGNTTLKSSSGNSALTNRQKYIASLLGRRRK